MADRAYDVVIAGASFGGVAAALAAAQQHVRVALIESSAWVGGQATSQGCTRWDEPLAELTETTGASKSYRDLRNAIRAEYAGARSATGRQQTFFNPGFARTGPPFQRGDLHAGSPFRADPQLVRGILTAMLRDAGVDVRLNTAVTRVNVDGEAVASVEAGGDTYTGAVFLDATDLGDLLPLAGVSWMIGAESVENTGEDEAAAIEHREWIQPFTVPIAVIWRPPGEDHRIAKPPQYDQIRQQQAFDRLKMPGKHGGDGDIRLVYNPPQESDTVFNYRQFIDPRNFAGGRAPRTTINQGSNDYLARAIPSDPPSAQTDAQIIEAARAVSVAYLYYLQNDVPRDDGKGTGYPNLQADTEAFGTADGTAPVPYIRESRRLAKPYVRVVQRDIDAEDNGLRARTFVDSCGIGWYAADVHEGYWTPDGDVRHARVPNIGTPWHGIKTAPFQIPLGALISQELTNFVAGCKNIGATHLTSGAYRVHPAEWAIGEAAGMLGAYCKHQSTTPRETWTTKERVIAYQSRLLARGVPLFWWDDVYFEHDARAFAAIHLLGLRGTVSGEAGSRDFSPDTRCDETQREAIDERENRQFDWPSGDITRAQAAVLVCEQLGLPV